MEKLELKFRAFLSNRCSNQSQNFHGVGVISEVERGYANYRQFYLLFHHVGFWSYLIAHSGLITSMEDNGVLFYCILFLFCLSLDLYYSAARKPGFVTSEPADTTDLYFCEVCQMHCPIRACHCKACGRCVMRRDHHCPWTNCCVGRDNHLYFVLWLMVESLVMILINGDIIFSLIQPKPIAQWFLDNIGLLCVFGLTMFDLGFVGWLLYGHCTMAANNFTVWERKRRQKISYLKDLPEGMNPFDNGIWSNIIEFVTMRYTNKEWEKPRQVCLDDMITEKNYACMKLGVDPMNVMPAAMQKSMSVGHRM